MSIIRYGLVLLLSYLIGCSSMALYISKYKKVDIRKSGSGNLGASNTTRCSFSLKKEPMPNARSLPRAVWRSSAVLLGTMNAGLRSAKIDSIH